MIRSQVVEIAPFTLAEGIGTDALLSASRRLEAEFLAKADGYVGRVLLQTDERAWMDLVFWRSREAADAVTEAAAQSEVCRDYFACMAGLGAQDAGAGVTHHRIIQGYGGIDV